MNDATVEAKEVPVRFSDMGTLVKERPRFDPQCRISIETFASLVAATHMREDLVCQLEHSGSRCNQWHNSGWLAKRKDGVEGLIGGICANKYFNASDLFRTERNRLGRELAVEDHLNALAGLLRDRDAVSRRARNVRHSLSATRRAIRYIQEALPAEVVYRLQDMVKRGSRGQVEVEVLYVEKDEKGNEESKWRLRDIGAVSGLAVWNPASSAPIYPMLDAIEGAIGDAVLSRESPLAKLKTWREAIEQLPHCEQQAAALERALVDFSRPENVGLLCHLVRNQDRQRDIAALVLRMSGVECPPSFKIQDQLNEIQQHVRNLFDGRTFRIAY